MSSQPKTNRRRISRLQSTALGFVLLTVAALLFVAQGVLPAAPSDAMTIVAVMSATVALLMLIQATRASE